MKYVIYYDGGTGKVKEFHTESARLKWIGEFTQTHLSDPLDFSIAMIFNGTIKTWAESDLKMERAEEIQPKKPPKSKGEEMLDELAKLHCPTCEGHGLLFQGKDRDFRRECCPNCKGDGYDPLREQERKAIQKAYLALEAS